MPSTPLTSGRSRAVVYLPVLPPPSREHVERQRSRHGLAGKTPIEDNEPLLRTRLRVWTSSNLGATWEDHAVVWEEAAGYSALTVLTGVPGANSALAPLGILYDRNNHSMAIFEAQSVSWTTVAA